MPRMMTRLVLPSVRIWTILANTFWIGRREWNVHLGAKACHAGHFQRNKGFKMRVSEVQGEGLRTGQLFLEVERNE